MHFRGNAAVLLKNTAAKSPEVAIRIRL